MVSITVAPDALPKMKTQSFQRLGHINAMSQLWKALCD